MQALSEAGPRPAAGAVSITAPPSDPAERILADSREIWQRFHSHPFVRGIADGSLSAEKFRFFMVQDYLYLYEYAKVFSLGAAKADDPAVQKTFSGYVSSILSGEMDIHRLYMRRLGITPEEAEGASMALDNLSYTSYMLRAAYEGGPAELCAAILPCAVSYEELARRMVEENPACAEHPFYGEWIRGYADEGYRQGNEELKDLTRRICAGLEGSRLEKLCAIGRNCSRYEGLFWDMAWEMRP